MRINRLELQGIGPFRDKLEIDFDLLGESGLYLIDGETGAGKSTLIDAIVYGIYGNLAGTDSDESRLRSKFSNTSSRSYVVVDFTTAKGQFRIERSPKYTRRAMRGNGETTQEAKAALYRINPDGSLEPIEDRIVTLQALIPNEIVGLTKAQFVQTVVLPQGEFANFLRADTKERSALMEKLFGTELYNKISELLKKDAAALLGELEKVLKDAADVLLVERNAAELSETEIADWSNNLTRAEFVGVIAECASRIDLIVSEREAADVEVQRVKDALEVAISDLAQRTREAETKRRFDLLQTSLLQRQQLKDLKLDALQARDSDIQKFGLKVASLGSPEEISAALNRLAESRTLAQAAISDEQRIRKWPSFKVESEAQINELEAALKEIEASIEGIPAKLKELDDQAFQKALLAGRKAELEAEKQQLENGLQKVAELAKAQVAYEKVEQSLKVATSKALSAQKELSDAQHARILNMAGELASELQPGIPCAVCGSTEHPAPAELDNSAVSVELIEELQVTFDKAQNQQSTLSAEVAAAKQKMETLQGEVSELGDVAAKLSEVESAILQAKDDFKIAEAAEREAGLLRAQETQITGKVAKINKDIAVITERLDSEKREIEKLEVEISSIIDGFESAEAKAEAASELFQVLKDFETAAAEVKNVASQLAEVENELNALGSHPDFGNFEAAETKQRELQFSLREVDQVFAHIKAREEALLRISKKLAAAENEYKSNAASNADLLLLATTFNRDEENQQTLTIYVLAKLFENVLAGANRYLEGLLNAQFRLEIEQQDGDRRSLRGLGIKVFDAFASDYRPAKTLSGGETFCVSLSLALGLADFVRQGAGGIEIGTLFIDEGFGTLSDGPLTDVMNMLTSLQKNGRTIGLISHVDEMKSQISEKIEVKKASKESPATLQVSWH